MKTSRKSWIPEVSEERIQELAERIKPVVQFAQGRCYIKPVDLFAVAYTWGPEVFLFYS